jgi:histidinol-phosphate/aromatic aminotransferase/cobyric acid decarboxylase-like protein
MTKTLNALHHLYHQVTPWNFELLQESIKYEALSDKSFYDEIIKEIIKKREEQKAEYVKKDQSTKQELELKELKLKVEK